MANSDNNCIYIIVCSKSNEAYIGRTKNPPRRYAEHLHDKNSAVYTLAQKYGKQSLFMVILKTGLSHEEACRYEAKYIYENYFCFNLVNSALPSEFYLQYFCNSYEDYLHYLNLFKRIDDDLNSNSPRINISKNVKSKSGRARSFSYYFKKKVRKLNE